MATESTDGWDVFFERAQSVGPTIAALLVLIGVGVTVLQKNATDTRALWWSRVEWAADHASSSDADRRAVGMAALGSLSDDPNRSKSDLELLGAIVDTQLRDLAGTAPDVQFVLGEE